MPTKLNRAGEQQNYVPKGNGDASGEYGDKETGSNVHITFKSFKKPETETSTTTESVEKEPQKEIGIDVKEGTGKEEPIESNGKGIERLTNSLTTCFLKHQKSPRLSPVKKQLITQIEDANSDMADAVAEYVESTNPFVKVGRNVSSKFHPRTNQVDLGSEAMQSYGIYSKGGTIFHEFGHGIDHTATTYDGRKTYWSSNFYSEKHGSTLSDMVDKEINSVGLDTLKKAMEDYKNNLKAKKEYDAFELANKDIKDLATNTINAAIEKDPARNHNQELLSKWRSGEISYSQLVEQRRTTLDPQIIIDEYKKVHPEYVEYSKKSQELYDKMQEEERQVRMAFSDLSDMCDAAFKGLNLGCGGHGKSYWYQEYTNQGTEAFAEIMSAKATSPESYKLMQKYIPKSLEIFEEIMKYRKAKGIK